jgi:hypothetical protein
MQRKSSLNITGVLDLPEESPALGRRKRDRHGRLKWLPTRDGLNPRTREGAILDFKNRVSIDAATGCWIWMGHIRPDGYGRFMFANEIYANRASWALFNGSIPDGMMVLHKCPNGHNRSCVNPNHLYLGTHLQNMADKQLNGTNRSSYGETHYRALLTDEQVKEIRRVHRKGIRGFGMRALSKRFGVAESTVFAIIHRINWKHI